MTQNDQSYSQDEEYEEYGLPRVYKSEMVLIGAGLLWGSSLDVIANKVQPEHFMKLHHKAIYALMLASRVPGDPSDPFTIVELARKNDIIRHFGGEDTLSDYLLEAANAVPSQSSIPFALEFVLEQWARREYAKLAKMAETSTIDELRIFSQRIADNVALKNPPPTGRLGPFDTSRKKKGVPSGYKVIDGNTVCNGYPSGQAVAICAYAKAGKTSTMIDSALKVVMQGYTVVYATFADMSGEDIQSRATKNLTGWSYEPDEPRFIDEYHEALRMLREDHHVEIYDAAAMETGHDVETFIAWLKVFHARHPKCIAFMDYAQELTTSDRSAKSQYEIGVKCASLVQRAARMLDIPIIVGSQVTEGVNGARDITKGGRMWEEKFGMVVKIKRLDKKAIADIPQEYQGIEGISTIEIPYQRFGPEAMTYAKWNEKRIRYDELP